MTSSEQTLGETLRLPSGPVDLASYPPRSTPGFDGDKAEGKKALSALEDPLGDLQERLFAQGKSGGLRRILLVLQGMDTSGKGGVMRHAVALFDPQGVQIKTFKAPTSSERRHDFLWRVERELPGPGMIGIFDRSHYEDVLIVRVHDLVRPAQWKRRYATINTFEHKLVEDGTTLIKVMMHISKDEQGERLAERLERPDKYWKYNPGDVTERGHWEDYQEAYQVALERCSTDQAPWFVVPADRKWYARLAVQQLLLEHLRALGLAWPEADFDIETEKQRLADS